MYQCPNCSANIKFDIARQAMFCDHCGTVMSPEELVKDKDAENGEYMEVSVMKCPQCGGEIICDDNEAAVFCSYCGGSTILDSRLEKTKRPKYILPFKKTKQECIQSYKSLLAKNIFAPSEMKKNIDASFRGIYMPYWTYGFKKNATFTVDGTKSYSRGNYTYTDHNNITASYELDYYGLCHDAAGSFADNLSEAIAPFDAKDQKEFTKSYLSGFYADVNDVQPEIYEEDMSAIAAATTYEKVREAGTFSGYSVDSTKAKKVLTVPSTSQELVMLPVWFMSTRVRDKGKDRVAYSVINGQTGKLACDMPISMKKYMIISLVVSAVIFIVMNFMMSMVYSPKTACVATMILAIIMGIVFHVREGEINRRETGQDDKGLMSVSGNQQSSEGTVKKKGRHTFMWVPIVISIGLYVMDVIHDYYYYAECIFSIILILRMIIMTVSRFNLITTRKLPQFNRKGGDDRA